MVLAERALCRALKPQRHAPLPRARDIVQGAWGVVSQHQTRTAAEATRNCLEFRVYRGASLIRNTHPDRITIGP